jgi:putative ABC transport system permease protein
MGIFELIALVIENLGRRKGRVLLTAIGVVIGTASVVILVSLAVGLQMDATSRLGGIGDLTLVQVYPGYDDSGGQMEFGPDGMPLGMTLITNDSLDQMRSLPGVVSVIPRDGLQAGGQIKVGTLEGYSYIQGIGITDLSELGLEAAQGSLVLEKGTVIVGSMVSQNFYDPHIRPGDEPPPPPDLMGQTMSLIMIKWDQTTQTEIRKIVQVKVVGVIAESRGEADWSIYMGLDEVTKYNEWSMGRRVNRNKDGYPQATVRVAEISEAVTVADAINEMGFQADTPQSFVQGINSFFVVLQVVFGGVGAIALLVAAIGIANTMAMAILERTREIGLMKAVGATNRDVLSVFLGEAAGIGLLGGLGGVLGGWSLGQVINQMALYYLAQQAATNGGPPPTVAVYTPLWLPIFALIFATIMGLLSGLYPALRAATLVPVTALKYE